MNAPVRRLMAGAAVTVAAVTVFTGCARTVDGTAAREGAGPRNNDSQETYPNLLKECDVLTTDVIAKTVGADPADIQSTGLVDITRFWFEQGSLDNEKKVAAALNYQTESRNIAGVPSIVMRSGEACGVASDAAGVVGWWVNPQAAGIDACGQATKLMELTLATSS